MLRLAAHVRPGNLIGLFAFMVIRYVACIHDHAAVLRVLSTRLPDDAARDHGFETLLRFCRHYADEIAVLLRTRNMNTSVVARAACVLPAMSATASSIGGPFDLIEIGCGAGFNLWFDSFSYDYGSVLYGDQDADLVIGCRLIGGELPALDGGGAMRSRTGIERDALRTDGSLDERYWLESMLLPEMHVERRHLHLGLELSRGAYPVVEGDCLSVLPGLIEASGDAVCILHSHCLGQWDEGAREELTRLLAQASHDRRIDVIGIEHVESPSSPPVRKLLARAAVMAHVTNGRSFPSIITQRAYRSGKLDRQNVLGYADGFGSWIAWGEI
jgi:hypothetical protein